MEYELAKELKDAGFPMEYYEQAGVTAGVIPNFPTLSELIEACGDGVSLVVGGHIEITQPDGTRVKSTGSIASRSPFMGEGKTPEEAVAKLWLALNKK